MSYSFIQTPATASLAQSPVIFSVSSSTHVADSQFMYVGELTIWTGSYFDSGSGQTWTLSKYPSLQAHCPAERVRNAELLQDVQVPGEGPMHVKHVYGQTWHNKVPAS